MISPNCSFKDSFVCMWAFPMIWWQLKYINKIAWTWMYFLHTFHFLFTCCRVNYVCTSSPTYNTVSLNCFVLIIAMKDLIYLKRQAEDTLDISINLAALSMFLILAKSYAVGIALWISLFCLWIEGFWRKQKSKKQKTNKQIKKANKQKKSL